MAARSLGTVDVEQVAGAELAGQFCREIGLDLQRTRPDHRQDRHAGHGQVAGISQTLRDDAGERRPQDDVIALGLDVAQRCLGHVEARLRIVQLLRGGRPVGSQRRDSRVPLAGQLRRRSGALEPCIDLARVEGVARAAPSETSVPISTYTLRIVPLARVASAAC